MLIGQRRALLHNAVENVAHFHDLDRVVHPRQRSLAARLEHKVKVLSNLFARVWLFRQQHDLLNVLGKNERGSEEEDSVSFPEEERKKKKRVGKASKILKYLLLRELVALRIRGLFQKSSEREMLNLLY